MVIDENWRSVTGLLDELLTVHGLAIREKLSQGKPPSRVSEALAESFERAAASSTDDVHRSGSLAVARYIRDNLDALTQHVMSRFN